METRIPQQTDRKQLIKFLNKIFNKKFPKLLPRLYSDEADSLKHHLCVYDGGKPVSAVAAIPNVYTLCEGETLKCIGIGMVSTAPSARGKGIMSKLLTEVLDKAKADGADFAKLGGMRERYSYFGFQPGGAEYTFRVDRGATKKYKTNGKYTFMTVNDNTHNKELFEIYSSQNLVCDRTEKDIFLYTSAWLNVTILAYCNGKAAGYLTHGKNKSHLELVVKPEFDARDLLISYLRSNVLRIPNSAFVEACPSETKLIKELSAVCENYEIRIESKFKIFNYRNVTEKLLKHRLRIHGLANTFSVGVAMGNEKFRIEYDGNDVSVTDLDGAPDVTLTESEAAYELFGGATVRKLPFFSEFTVPHSDGV